MYFGYNDQFQQKNQILVMLSIMIFTFYSQTPIKLKAVYEDVQLRWFFDFVGSASDATPELIDINNDSYMDVLLLDDQGILYAVDGRTGLAIWELNFGIIDTHVKQRLSDLDSDGLCELVITYANGSVFIVNPYNVTVIAKINLFTGYSPFSMPCISDVDNDSLKEIFLAAKNGFGYLLKFNATEELPLSLIWKLDLDLNPKIYPVMIDTNNDSFEDIIVGSFDGYIYSISSIDKKILFRYYLNLTDYSQFSVLDIDNDGVLEIITTRGNELIIFSSDTGNLEDVEEIYDEADQIVLQNVFDIDYDSKYEFIMQYYYLFTKKSIDYITVGEIIVDDDFDLKKHTEETDTYNNVKQKNLPLWSYVADLNGDFWLDFAFTSFAGVTIYSSGANKFIFTLDGSNLAPIPPYLYDFDKDGVLELLLIEDFGRVNLYDFNNINYGNAVIPFRISENNNAADQIQDYDNDGLSNLLEMILGTNALNNDSDNDSLNDYYEVKKKYNPLSIDTDGDGLNDPDELKMGLSPRKRDSDGDGWIDASDPIPTINNYFVIGGVVAIIVIIALVIYLR
ncbi:MAG: hypothetical protein J7K59_07370 [Candidatus Korarchaeota archaeon]|nr:hypothetical protein [Candidatus Korarchaeota archaeon]